MDMLCPAVRFKPGDRIYWPSAAKPGKITLSPEVVTVSIDDDRVRVNFSDGEWVIYERPAGDLINRREI